MADGKRRFYLKLDIADFDLLCCEAHNRGIDGPCDLAEQLLAEAIRSSASPEERALALATATRPS